jgi:hypothetical protein
VDLKHGLQVGQSVWSRTPILEVDVLPFLERKLKHLLPKYTSLISDQHQTRNGAAFWQKMLELAFKKRKNVYFLDRRATPNRLTHLKSMLEIHKLTPDLWGRSEGHKRTFAIISQSRLQLIPKS